MLTSLPVRISPSRRWGKVREKAEAWRRVLVTRLLLLGAHENTRAFWQVLKMPCLVGESHDSQVPLPCALRSSLNAPVPSCLVLSVSWLPAIWGGALPCMC